MPGKVTLSMAACEFLSRKDHARARAAQGFVRGRGNDVRVRHWRRMRAAGDQSGEVRHVDHEQRARLVGDLAHAGEIDDPRIGAATADDHLGMMFERKLFEIVVVDGLGFLGHAVGNDLVSLAGEVQRMPVREVSAVREVQPEDRVARLENGAIGFHVGGGAGVRLDVGELRAEELLRAIARQVLDDVGELAAAVVALARDSLPHTCW